MYADAYSHLKAKLNVENFETIAKAIDEYFGDIFRLDALELEARKDENTGSYWRFFETCMKELEELYTVGEVVQKLQENIDNYDYKQFIFVPSAGNQQTRQIAFLEKMATEELRIAEPLSLIDMQRLICGIGKLKKKNTADEIAAVHLQHMPFLDIEALKQKKALLVNFNHDLKSVPKWGVIDLSQSEPRVYCESPLTEREKKSLESNLNLKINHQNYLGSTANSLPSTGYAAIAWLDQNIAHAWNFDVDADFPSLLKDFILLHFGGDNPGLSYKLDKTEYDLFACKGFKMLLPPANEMYPSSPLVKVASASVLGEIKKARFCAGDISHVLKILAHSDPTETLESSNNRAQRTLPPGFARTMQKCQEKNYPQLVHEDAASIKLTVPEKIDFFSLSQAHESLCIETKANHRWLNFLPQTVRRAGSKDEYYASMMVLALMRAKSKKRRIEIDLPSPFALNREEQQFIVQNMTNNAFVTEFIVGGNSSLTAVKAELLPILARNRWLKEKGYLPPLIDDYWRQAAKYWLVHLHEEPAILELKKEHQLFKRCVHEMGLLGLKHLLGFLSDPLERDFLERVYGRNKPQFYASCEPHQFKEYLQELINYLKKNEYFPFNELGIAYHPGNDELLCVMLGEINKLERFEKLKLTEFLTNDFDLQARYQFLQKLSEIAVKESWTSLVVIPELEDKENQKGDLKLLYNQYSLLNDIILHNRHELAGRKTLKEIEKESDFTAFLAEEKQDVIDEINDDIDYDSEEEVNELNFNDFDKTWPLKKGGVVQLQLQQQMQIEQNRQIQQEQQKVIINVIEDPIAEELVDYTNIDRLLGGFLKKYQEENDIDERYAPLKQEHETLLQKFFHTWINAAPKVDAQHVIKFMTQDAAKALLRKHGKLASGLNLDNLPKGFYTQRSKNGHLILCYSPELSYVNTQTNLTINLDARKPKAESWEGDFRQFDLKQYLSKNKLDESAWKHIKLFAQLQLEQKDYSKEYELFKINNPSLKLEQSSILSSVFGSKVGAKQKILNNWLIFLQAWHYAGEEGVKQFLALDEKTIRLSNQEISQLLFKNQPKELQIWLDQHRFDEKFLRAIGQVYYRYGDSGVTLLLRKFSQIENALGEGFFAVFHQSVLSTTNTFNCFMSPACFKTLDDMMTKLNPNQALGKKLALQAVLTKQMQGVDWESIETLWRGFDYFTAELEQLGLELKGNEFDAVEPGNMLICMDRILASLKHIPNADEQQRFLASLGKLDLTHGGVHYALQHENFKRFSEDLKLYDFAGGTPTYAPDLTNLYQWGMGDAPLNIKRALASQSRFSHEAYRTLVQALGNAELVSRHYLIWLFYTQYNAHDINDILQTLQKVDATQFQLIALHLHQAVYVLGNQQLNLSLEAMAALTEFMKQQNIGNILKQYPNGTFLEAFSILYQCEHREKKDFDKLYALFAKGAEGSLKPDIGYPESLYLAGFKLATLFGVYNTDNLKQFYEATHEIKPVVMQELNLLIRQLLSIDYQNSDLSALESHENWQAFIDCLKAMNKEPGKTAGFRIRFIESLNEQNILFKYSKNGEFRALTTREQDGPHELNFFVDHEARLWNFIKGHIAVPIESDAKEALQPIMRFLKRLQLNRTYLNEIEPLLSTLEKTDEGKYWSASYFYQMLRALQPENEEISFPISLLKVLLKEQAISAKSIDSVERNFPNSLEIAIKNILKNTVFERDEQARLCQLALREFNWQGRIALVNQIMATLSTETYAASRGHVLEILAKAKHNNELESRFHSCCWLLQHAEGSGLSDWSDITAIWMKALSAREHEEKLYSQIKSSIQDEKKQALILKIIAYSALHPGLKDHDVYEYELNKKAPKLVSRLGEMALEDLASLAACYPRQPSPAAEDILRLLKKQKDNHLSFKECLDGYLRHPYSLLRMDYGTVSAMREVDLQRMISEATVMQGEKKTSLSLSDASRLTLIFAHLKHLENGSERIDGYEHSVAHMSQEELAKAYQELSDKTRKHPDSTQYAAQIWAVLFEVMGRTTQKYPHLAQQFSLIANDSCMNAQSRIVLLKTGEGKSHFIAMRAARHAGLGKTVDVCTAKRTLAERDLEDYKAFFDYLNLKTAYIHPKSSHDDYVKSQIRYSTTGDISLFLDEQSYSGTPVRIEIHKRVALFDEFDFIRFEEGTKTEYNYARPTGKTPKQMTWFYQEVNAFYKQNETFLMQTKTIDVKILQEFYKALKQAAEGNEERENILDRIVRDPLQLVQWLQAAHETHALEWGVGFTVREENIEVGDESYPMREIIPLSSDNQKMIGSTFSAGVQQLLAVRLNTEARQRGEAQNFHIHPESNIISSQVAAQRMRELWGQWEGFSGTISAAQAAALHAEQGTEVLQVPTNQRDLRLWHKPRFYENENQRLDALVKQIRICLKNRQSILFSCKNDKHVKTIEAQLKQKLTEQELKQFIFYTNEEHRSAPEVLKDKEILEQWRGGKKQQAVGLVASGFGRGDNVGVEAVFLFDVSDTNDKLQKGGRTARNGAEGEVFQFYINSELENEEFALLQQVNFLAKKSMAEVDEKLKQVAGSSDAERCFERVMLLREYVFALQNAANQGYRSYLAQLSSWGMENLGQIDDPKIRSELTSKFSALLKELDKKWIDISSDHKLGVNKKIAAIGQEIERGTHIFSNQCQQALKQDIKPLQLNRHAKTRIQLVVPRPEQKHSMRDWAKAEICRVLAKFDAHDAKLEKTIPGWLAILEKNEARLMEFARDAASCDSFSQFLQKLRIAVEQIEKPSKEWQSILDHSEIEIPEGRLFDGVSANTKLACKKALNNLLPEHQEGILQFLRAPSLLPAEKRWHAALPVIQHLGDLQKFTVHEQEMWVGEYIEHLPELMHMHQDAPYELKLRLKHSKHLGYRHFDAIWRLVKAFDLKQGELDPALRQLNIAIQNAPEQRLRALAQLENWAGTLPKEERVPFLLDFCQVMEHCKEGENWDTFLTLMKQTNTWWAKGDGEYTQELRALWQELALRKHSLGSLNGFLQWSIKLGGKSWFEVTTICFKAMSIDAIVMHSRQLLELWNHLDTILTTKQEKNEQFGGYAVSLESMRHFIENRLNNQKEGLLRALSGLNHTRLMKLLDDTEKYKEAFDCQPELLAALMEYLSDESIPLAKIDLLTELLMRVHQYRQNHQNADITVLLRGIERFKGKEEAILHSLLKLFDGTITAMPLFDNAAEFLATKIVSEEAREDVLKVMKRFYEVASRNNSKPEAMFGDASLTEYFEFVNQHTQKERSIYMHLHYQQVFNKDDAVSETQIGEETLWDMESNNQLLSLAYERYTNHTKTLLGEPCKSVHRISDLTGGQHSELLRLTDELATIADPSASVFEPNTDFNQLQSDLNMLLAKYRSCWFKSITRRMECDQIQQGIDDSFNAGIDGQSRYQAVLTAIMQTKMLILEADLQENTLRPRWFKINRGGESRLLNTLNQMQDMVLRHWSKDKTHLQQFQVYQQVHQEQFKSLAGSLFTALSNHCEETYLSPDDPRNNDILRKIGNFFSNPARHREALRKISNAVFNFKEAHAGDEAITEEKLSNLIKTLREGMSAVPGHIKPLVNELLSRGDAMIAHCKGKNELLAVQRMFV